MGGVRHERAGRPARRGDPRRQQRARRRDRPPGRQADPAYLEAQLGSAGPWLHDLANGIDPRAVEPDTAAKSVGAEETFRQALCEARDDFARLLARTWDRTSVRDFPGRGPAYAGVVTNMLAADRAVTGGRYGEIIRKAFRQRGIVPSGRRA